MHKCLFGIPFENNDLHQAVAVLFKLRGAVISHGRAVNVIGTLAPTTQFEVNDFEWEFAVYKEIEVFLAGVGLLDEFGVNFDAGLPPAGATGVVVQFTETVGNMEFILRNTRLIVV